VTSDLPRTGPSAVAGLSSVYGIEVFPQKGEQASRRRRSFARLEYLQPSDAVEQLIDLVHDEKVVPSH
jgi:hypothetical protein